MTLVPGSVFSFCAWLGIGGWIILQESVGLKGAEVKIPSFTKRRAQLNAFEIEAHVTLLMSEYMLNG